LTIFLFYGTIILISLQLVPLFTALQQAPNTAATRKIIERQKRNVPAIGQRKVPFGK
jgi:hypothetical protein